MTLDVPTCLRLGRLIQACYAPEFLTSPESLDVSGLGADKLCILYSKDPEGTVPYAVVCRDKVSSEVIVAIRGTEGFWEWAMDGEAILVPCPFLPSGCRTERGFTSLYASLCNGVGVSAKQILTSYGVPVTVAGHSLGAALATELAVDIRASGLVTFGSPRVGNQYWVSQAVDCIANNMRYVTNQAGADDVVTTVPFDVEEAARYFEFHHVGPPTVLAVDPSVPNDIKIRHSLNTYLATLSP